MKSRVQIPLSALIRRVLRNIIKADESLNSLPQNWDLNAQASTIDI